MEFHATSWNIPVRGARLDPLVPLRRVGLADGEADVVAGLRGGGRHGQPRRRGEAVAVLGQGSLRKKVRNMFSFTDKWLH